MTSAMGKEKFSFQKLNVFWHTLSTTLTSPASGLLYFMSIFDFFRFFFGITDQQISTVILSLPLIFLAKECAQYWLIAYIMKTCLYNFGPLKPHFYIVKLGFTGVNIIFLISSQNIYLWYSLEPPRRGGSNEYPQSSRGGSNEYPQFMFWAEIWKI